jgi:hypothetical protein
MRQHTPPNLQKSPVTEKFPLAIAINRAEGKIVFPILSPTAFLEKQIQPLSVANDRKAAAVLHLSVIGIKASLKKSAQKLKIHILSPFLPIYAKWGKRRPEAQNIERPTAVKYDSEPEIYPYFSGTSLKSTS